MATCRGIKLEAKTGRMPEMLDCNFRRCSISSGHVQMDLGWLLAAVKGGHVVMTCVNAKDRLWEMFFVPNSIPISLLSKEHSARSTEHV